MDITPIISKDANIIKSYGDGKVKVKDKIYKDSIIIFPDKVINWSIEKYDDLNIESFSQIKDDLLGIEILILGAGDGILNRSKEIDKFLSNYNITLELMNFGAACRTYNILLAESRKVTLMLIN